MVGGSLLLLSKMNAAASASQISSSSTTAQQAPPSSSFVPASQANSIGASAVVGSSAAVSGNSTFTDVSSLNQIVSSESAAFNMQINNTSDTLTLSGAPSNQVIQIYNLKNGQLIFNTMGNGSSQFTPSLSSGLYVAIALGTKQRSNVVVV